MEVRLIRSNRKTISIRINPDLTLTVRAPKRLPSADIERFLHEKESWIRKHVEEIKKNRALYGAEDQKRFTAEEINELADRALSYFPGRVEHFAKILGVSYGRITIRNQKTRWGSCSSKGNLNFNCLLMLAPPEVIDYIIVHELCHRKEMNHSRTFWNEVEKVIPDYRDSIRWLKNEGSVLMNRQY